jgi:hypothetical protein
MKSILALAVILSLTPQITTAQAVAGDYIWDQKQTTGPAIPRKLTPIVGGIAGWPSNINTPGTFTLGSGFSVSGSTINVTGGTPAWADITGKPTTLAGFGITDAITAATAASTYLPLAGGTLTGELIGATAQFTGGVQVSGNLFAGAGVVIGSTLPEIKFELPGTTGSTTGSAYFRIIDPTVEMAESVWSLRRQTGTIAFTSDLNALNASNLTSGTIPDARFPATLPAANGSSLTALNASNITSGILPSARLGQVGANGTWTSPNITVDIYGRVTSAINRTATQIIDTIGSTQGQVLFRGASAWTALAPGTNGQVLTSGGAGANPTWTSGGVSNGNKGDITVSASGATWTINAGSVIDAAVATGISPGKLTTPTATILGRASAGTGAVESLSAAQVRAITGNPVVQRVRSVITATSSGTTVADLRYSATAPAMTHGDQYMTITITPTSATNRIRIRLMGHWSNSAATQVSLIIGRAGDTNARSLHTTFPSSVRSDYVTRVYHEFDEVAGGTSAITYNVRAGGTIAGTMTFNTAQFSAGTPALQQSWIEAEEYVP